MTVQLKEMDNFWQDTYVYTTRLQDNAHNMICSLNMTDTNNFVHMKG